MKDPIPREDSELRTMQMEAVHHAAHHIGAVVDLPYLILVGDAALIHTIHDQSDFGTFGILHFQQMSNLEGPINFGPALLWACVTPTCQGFRKKEDAAGAIADILIVLTLGSATLHRDGLSCFSK